MEETIFTKIIKGEVPSSKLYENDHAVAILDINPVRNGHTIIIAKRQEPQLIDLPDGEYYAMWQMARKVALHLREKLGVERVAMKVIGIDVPHAHIHLIPFTADEEPVHDDASPTPVGRDLDDLAERLRLAE